MLYTANMLKEYRFLSLDGDIGKVKEFFFDDHHWVVRYLLADTGSWLSGRQVLISPYSILDVNKEEQIISINLTKKQIEDSPSLEQNKPVLQQFELAYYSYFGWPKYWHGPYTWGSFSYVPRDQNKWRNGNQDSKTWSPNLHSTVDLLEHHILANDGEFGQVEDFIIDEEVWAIRYLIINSHNWWMGKKLLIAPNWIDRTSWKGSQVVIQYSRETIRNSPEYTKLSFLTRDLEIALHQHYERLGYWSDQQTAR